jgi:ribosomal protein L32
MKRLLSRPPRRRAKHPQATEAAPAAEVQPTEDRSAVPAGAEPADPAAPPQPSFRNRARLRRRLRFLRRVRELGFRDLGGLVFDQHKFSRPNEELVRGKVAALAAVDAELRALEDALRQRREITELREPGISACPRCGTLHGSDARFCPSCGLALTGSRTIAADVGEGAHAGRPQLEPGSPPAPEAEPAAAHVAEREAGKTERDGGRDGSEQPTVVARPGPERAES